MKKKTWNTPELIVFVKAEPEDSILTHCKSSKSPSYQNTATKGNHCQAAVTVTSDAEARVAANCGACQSNGGGLS